MDRFRSRRWLLACTLLAAFSTTLAGVPAAGGNQSFEGVASVDAAGRLASFAAGGDIAPALAQALEEQLRSIVFVSSVGAGSVHLSGTYRLTAEGDDYVLTLGEVQAAPKVLKQTTPRPPSHMLDDPHLSVWGRVAFEIDDAGKPVRLVVEHPNSGAFVRVLLDAMRQWRFAVPLPASNGKTPVRYRQDFIVRKPGTARIVRPDCPPLEDAAIMVQGQASCLPLVEGEVVRRVGGRL
jgi:hypothetical protein